MITRSFARARALRSGQLGGFASDSFYVGVWQASFSIADLFQIALLTRALGLTGYGRLALIVAFVTLVGQFFDVRMTTATTAFAAAKIPANLRSAAGIFQFSYLVDGLTGTVGFLMVAALAPLVGTHLGGHLGTQATILFAVTLLVGSLDDTSITILRLIGRFRLAAVCGTVGEIFRVLLLWLALSWSRDLRLVLAALIAYSALRVSINLLAATTAFRRESGGISVFQPALAEIRDERRAMLSMIVHTNIASYARLATTQLPTVLVGAISGPAQVGTYKVGMAAAAMIGRLGDPAMSAILPRVAKLWSLGKRAEIRRLVAHGTLLLGAAVSTALALVIGFRRPIIDLVTGGAYTTGVGVVLVLGALGYAVNAVLFWNGQVLFAARRARFVAIVLAAGAAVQVVIIAALASPLGAKAGALAFLVAQVLINVGLTAGGIRLLGSPGSIEPEDESARRMGPASERVVAPR